MWTKADMCMYVYVCVVGLVFSLSSGLHYDLGV